MPLPAARRPLPQVAHFELQEAAEGGPQDGAAAAADGAGAQATAAAAGAAAGGGVGFWEGLLSSRWAAAQVAAAADADLGKGKRHRRKVLASLNQDALLDALVGDDDDEEEEEEEGGSQEGRPRRGSRSGTTDRSGALRCGGGRACGGPVGRHAPLAAAAAAQPACAVQHVALQRPCHERAPTPTCTPAADDDYRVGSDEEEQERREAEEERQAALLLVRGWAGTAGRYCCCCGQSTGQCGPCVAANAEPACTPPVRPAPHLCPTSSQVPEERQREAAPAWRAPDQLRQRRKRRTRAEIARDEGEWSQAIRLSAAEESSLRPEGGWPLQWGAGDQLRVWGFSALQVGPGAGAGRSACCCWLL